MQHLRSLHASKYTSSSNHRSGVSNFNMRGNLRKFLLLVRKNVFIDSYASRTVVGCATMPHGSKAAASTFRCYASSRPSRSMNTDASSLSTNNHETVLLVESPAKAKKIQEYLGSSYLVLASYGHVRDLPARTGSVKPEEDFAMQWELAEGARGRMREIAEAVRKAQTVFLATDPDREGEAISWHLMEELKSSGAISENNTNSQRITFTEVTKPAVEAAIRNPRQVSQPLVEAYLARRALDYLFGFNISPLLWRKLPGARSAGRVQSVALRMVADRESAIEAFVPTKYWTVHAEVDMTGQANRKSIIEATLAKIDGKSPPSPGFIEESLAMSVKSRIEESTFKVAVVSKKESLRHPSPPFTTSTLQQEASRKMGWSASRTMQYAQKLYESGIITYMRTDGVFVAPQAIEALRTAIVDEHGPNYIPEKPRYYASRSKTSQEAHEAIRPTDFNTPPNVLSAQGVVEGAAVQLYSLIWSRTVASQMASAKFENIGAEFASEDGSVVLRTTTSYPTFPGYLAAYGVSKTSRAGIPSTGEEEEEEEEDMGDSLGFGKDKGKNRAGLSSEEAAKALSALTQGSPVLLQNPEAMQHETRPPGRFTEGTLVKALEEAGVGRPSTYAPTMKLLQSRRYLRKEGKTLHPEPLGRVLSAFLCKYFPVYVDTDFTSKMEDGLDEISTGKERWKDLLKGFWEPFHDRVSELGSLSGTEVIDCLNEELNLFLFGHNSQNKECPSCGSPLSLKLSHRGGPFVGCTTYPTCTYTRPAASLTAFEYEEKNEDQTKEGPGDKHDRLTPIQIADMYGMRGSARVIGYDQDQNIIFLRRGPFGAYVQRGIDKDPHVHRAPLPREMMKSVPLDYALAVLSLPRTLGVHPTTGAPVTANNGKFGPYVKHQTLMRSIPPDVDIRKMNLETALQLLTVAEKKKAKKELRAIEAKKRKEENDILNDVASQKGRKKRKSHVGTSSSSAAMVTKEETLGQPKRKQGAKLKVKNPRKAYHFYQINYLKERQGQVMEGAGPLAASWKEMEKKDKEVYNLRAELDKQRWALETIGLVEPGSIDWDSLSLEDLESKIKQVSGERNAWQLAEELRGKMKRPPSGYGIFIREMSERLTKENQTAPDLLSLAKMWQSLPQDEKDMYNQISKQAREAYTKEKQNVLEIMKALE